MPHTLLALAVAALFFAIEGALRRGQAATSTTPAPTDRGTTRVLSLTYALTLGAGLGLSRLGVGRLPRQPIASLGLLAMAAGLGLRVWAMRTLGPAYTRTLRVEADQRLVRSGPYRCIRHPGYLASLLVWVGFGVALANWLLSVSSAAALVWAYRRRMAAEERMLEAALGDAYRVYVRQTARLVPGLY